VGTLTRQERGSAQDTGVAAVDVLSTSRALAVIALPLGRVQLLQPAATIQVAIAGENLVQVRIFCEMIALAMIKVGIADEALGRYK
jgi:hypothetical protein